MSTIVEEECAISEIKSLIDLKDEEYNNIVSLSLVPSVSYIKKEMHHKANSPLDQFEIRDLISLNAPILGYSRILVTNIGLYLTTATVIALAFNLLGTNKDKIVANH